MIARLSLPKLKSELLPLAPKKQKSLNWHDPKLFLIPPLRCCLLHSVLLRLSIWPSWWRNHVVDQHHHPPLPIIAVPLLHPDLRSPWCQLWSRAKVSWKWNCDSCSILELKIFMVSEARTLMIELQSSGASEGKGSPADSLPRSFIRLKILPLTQTIRVGRMQKRKLARRIARRIRREDKPTKKDKSQQKKTKKEKKRRPNVTMMMKMPMMCRMLSIIRFVTMMMMMMMTQKTKRIWKGWMSFLKGVRTNLLLWRSLLLAGQIWNDHQRKETLRLGQPASYLLIVISCIACFLIRTLC